MGVQLVAVRVESVSFLALILFFGCMHSIETACEQMYTAPLRILSAFCRRCFFWQCSWYRAHYRRTSRGMSLKEVDHVMERPAATFLKGLLNHYSVKTYFSMMKFRYCEAVMIIAYNREEILHFHKACYRIQILCSTLLLRFSIVNFFFRHARVRFSVFIPSLFSRRSQKRLHQK